MGSLIVNLDGHLAAAVFQQEICIAAVLVDVEEGILGVEIPCLLSAEGFAEQIDEKVLGSAAGECVIYSHTDTSFVAGFYFAQQFQPFANGFFRSAMVLCQTGNIHAAAKFL